MSTKVAASYIGNDTYGRRIQLVVDTLGQQFNRNWAWNGYAMCWTRWAKQMEPCPIKGDYAEWGWNRLQYVPGPYRYRLP